MADRIKFVKTENLKQKPVDESKLGFGSIFTDYMFLMDYDEGIGWHDPRIVPYGPIEIDPAAACLHYAQEVFEGLKAYRAADGRILLFRPWENFKRLNNSNERLCIPKIDEELALEGLIKLVNIEKDWIPHVENASLYIRPFIIATEAKLGVKASSKYIYMVILSPSGPYYPEGLDPVKIYVEDKYVRSVKGGTGFVKTGGNYASSLIAQEEAHQQNYSQVLWLDGVERKYIEEVGAMNIFFVLDGEVVTPSLCGSILPGITRKSVIELLESWNIKVSERRITIDEIEKAYDDGKLLEVFGSGTAAVISPVGTLKYEDKVMEIGGGKIGQLSQKLYDNLTGIQWGNVEDKFGWTIEVK